MHYVYEALAPEYTKLLSICKIAPHRMQMCRARARLMLRLKPHYEQVSEETKVPILWMMVINERESGSRMDRYLGNGQRLDRTTTMVPKGRGPFDTWEEGALDALHIDKIDQVPQWSWPMLCFEEELWNGFGPRMHHRHTGYLWAGTNIYDGGKYVRDGVWSPSTWDTQIGTVPLMMSLVALDPSLNIDDTPTPAGPEEVSAPIGHPHIDVHNVLWVQTALNKLQGNDDLILDGSWGRHTARALREFQDSNGLPPTGIPGDDTLAALEKATASIESKPNGQPDPVTA